MEIKTKHTSTCCCRVLNYLMWHFELKIKTSRIQKTTHPTNKIKVAIPGPKRPSKSYQFRACIIFFVFWYISVGVLNENESDAQVSEKQATHSDLSKPMKQKTKHTSAHCCSVLNYVLWHFELKIETSRIQKTANPTNKLKVSHPGKQKNIEKMMDCKRV